MSKSKEANYLYELAEMKIAHCRIKENRKLAEITKQIQKCRIELDNNQKIKSNLIKENDEKTAQLNQLNEKIKLANEKKDLILKQVQDAELKRIKIEDKTNILNREVDELISSKKIAQKDISDAKVQLEFIKSQITIQLEKEKDISKKCEKIDSLRIQLINEANDYQQKIAQKANEIKDMQESIENLKKEIHNYEKQKEEGKKEFDEINKKIDQSLKNFEDLTSKTNNVKSEIKILQDKNNQLTKENTELSKENSDLMIQKAELNKKIIDEQNKIEQKQNEYNTIIEEINEVAQKKAQSKNELRKIMDDINNNLKIQNETQIKTCQLRNKLTEYEQEVINSRNEYSIILEHISSTQKMHRDLMNEMVTTASNQKEITDLTNREKNNFYESISPKKAQDTSSVNLIVTQKCAEDVDLSPPNKPNSGL